MTFYLSGIKVTKINGVSQSPAIEFTEHNRSTLPIGYDQIEMTNRMANGTMRKFTVATKRNIQVSWNTLPSRTDLTVDGKLGAGAIKAFYDTNLTKPITIEIRHHQTSSSPLASVTVETLDVFITSFSYEVIKRFPDYDWVNVSIGFTEI